MIEAYLFAAVGFAIAGQLADTWTTEAGLAHGLVEGNPVAKWLTAKIGNTGLTLLKCVGAAQALPILTYIFSKDVKLSAVLGLIVGGLGFGIAIKNYIVLRRNKIPFSFLP